MVGFTVGVENWFESQALAVRPNAQNGALPLIAFGADHERPRSSE